MKLNLVADYEIGGKSFPAAFSIDASQNLVALRELTALNIPTTDGGWVKVAARSLTMCKNARAAEEYESSMRREYQKQGRLYAFDMVELRQLIQEGKVTA